MDPHNPNTGQGAKSAQGQQGGAQAPLKVNIPDSVKPGVYSNAVSVSVDSNQVAVDFGYLLPNTNDPEIEVVSRVNLNHKTAESFLKVLGGAMEDFKKKQAEMNSKNAGAPAPAPMGPAPMPQHGPPAPMGPAPMPPHGAAPAPMGPAPAPMGPAPMPHHGPPAPMGPAPMPPHGGQNPMPPHGQTPPPTHA